MKKTLLIAAGMLALTQAQAQESLFKHRQNGKNDALIRSILKKQAGNTAQKPTGTAQRVVAQALHAIEDGELFIDSLRFTYSGANGSTYSCTDIRYNESFEPAYAPMYNSHRYPNNPLNLLADSILTYENGDLADISRAFYRGDKKMDSVYSYSGVGSSGQSIFHTLVNYTTGGQIKKIVNLESFDNGATYDTSYYSNYYYNNDFTKILADTTVYDPASFYQTNRYTYNAAGLPDTVDSKSISSGNPNQQSRVVLDYYSDGKLRKATMQQFVMSGWATESIDSLGYTSGADYYTYWKQSGYDPSGNPMYSGLTRYFPGTTGMPDSAMQYSSEDMGLTWDRMEKITFAYNSYNNPVLVTGTFYEDGTPVPEGQVSFYYELFDDAVSVKPVTDNKDFRVYPNPFDNQITIDWKGKTQGDVTVRMVNMLGQEIYHSSLKLAAGANTISIPAIHTGNYVLLLQDAQGKTWSTQVIKK